MSLYIVHKANPYFPNETILELFEDGFQKAKVNERGQVTGNEGLIIPEKDVLPYCMKLLQRGLDKPELRKPRHETDGDFDWEEYDFAGPERTYFGAG